MVNEFQVVHGMVVFDPESFKFWFPGMEMNYTIHGQPARKATTNQKFPRNYDRDGDELFPPDDIVHLMDEYTLAIHEEEEFVGEWEEGLEEQNELDEANEEGAEDEVQITGTKLATKPTSPSSPPVKVLKVQPAPKIPVPIVEHDKSKAAPRSIVVVDDDDQDPVQIDELRTLEEKLNKARYEFERSQQVLDAYKKQQKGISETEEQEQEQEPEGEEEEEEDVEEQKEEEETQEPKQDLQFIEMYNELVPEGYFMSMEAVSSFITKYEVASSNKLKVVASKVARGYRVYGCAEHENCPFRFHIGRKRGGDANLVVVKAMEALHNGRRREARAKDGRKWKTRRAGKYNEIIGKIRQHKEKPPLPGDVMKAVATQQNETISYSTAWRSITGVERLQLQQQILSFQLIIPYLQRLSRDNPESRIVWEKYPNTQRIRRLLVCHSFMNETIKSVIPVISLDGAHIDSKWKCTFITASALSSNRELYLIAFAFTEGNEDHQT